MKSAAGRVAYRYLYARILRAMSLERARDVLGFPPGYNPTPQEVNKAQRRKTFEVHPDRGGDPAKMIEVNVAADVLTGKQRAKPDYAPPPEPPPAPEPPPPPPPEMDAVSYEQAMAGLNVSTQTYWMWVSTYLKRQLPDDELLNGGLDSAWVCYGRDYNRNTHVFVLVATGAYWNTTPETETWWVGKPVTFDRRSTVKQAMARGIPAAMKQLPGFTWRDKVYPIGSGPVGGRRALWKQDFDDPKGSALSIKAWMESIGEAKQKPLTVFAELRGYYDAEGHSVRDLVITVNGHETVFGDRDRRRHEIIKKVGPLIFSKRQLDYWEGKKNLTRMQNLRPLDELLKEIDMDLSKEDADKIREFLKRAGVR